MILVKIVVKIVVFIVGKTVVKIVVKIASFSTSIVSIFQARARRACALRALGLLLADGTPTVGGGKTF